MFLVSPVYVPEKTEERRLYLKQPPLFAFIGKIKIQIYKILVSMEGDKIE